MTLNVLTCGLSGVVGKLPVTQTIDHTYQRALPPLLDHKCVTIHGHQRAGTCSDSKDKRAGQRRGTSSRSHRLHTMLVPAPGRELTSNSSISRLTAPKPQPRLPDVQKSSPMARCTFTIPGP